MKIVFGIVVFIFLVILVMLVVGFLLSSQFGGSPGGIRTGKASGGIFASKENEHTWETKTKIEGEERFMGGTVLDIVFDPHNSQVAYAGVPGGAYRSKNAMDSWEKLTVDPLLVGPKESVQKVGIDPMESRRLYLVLSKSLLRSEDGGEIFEKVYSVATPQSFIHAFAIDPFDSRTVYVGTSDGLVLQSGDYGVSWKTLSEFEGKVTGIIVKPSDTRILYAVVADRGLYKSLDKGSSWIDISEALTKKFSGGIFTNPVLTIDPHRHDTLLLGSAFGFVRSDDGGNSFEEVKTIIPSQSLPILSISVHPYNTETLYLGALNQLYKSVDRGTSWSVETLPTAEKIKQILISGEGSESRIIIRVGK